MILLSEDGKSLVEISGWEDIISRPGYHSKVDHNQVKLKAIIGKYRINPKQPCGISSCGTAHNKGYLVVCDNGIETNIGHNCGKNIFDVDFVTLENKFNRDTNAQRYREKIKEQQNKIDNYRNVVTLLKTGDRQSDWCYKQMHFYATKGFEEKTLKRLHQRSKTSDNRILLIKDMSKREIELAREAGSNETHTTELLDLINGIQAFRDYKKLKNLVLVHLGDEFKQFIQLESDTLGYEDLKFWNNWVNRLDMRIEKTRNIISDCQRFLSESNLATIRKYKAII